jgi:steroid delta-isomerase-like uncharacterized protein
MSTPQLVQAFYEHIWNMGNFDAIPELLADGFAFRGSLGVEMRGRKAFAEYVHSVRESLSDYRCTILDCVSEGDQAFAKMRFSGFHTGAFRGYPPTGRLIGWFGAGLFRFEHGLIVELWVLGDLAGLDHTLQESEAPISESQDLLIRDTKREELEQICEMEQGEAQKFIIPYSLERHQAELVKPDVVYKSIWHEGEFIGFLILVLDQDGQSVEFRRIVIARPGRGYGKRVVRMVDEVCRNELGRTRIWLDVFETNERARHVYQQCGYQLFGKSEHEGRTLLLYEK